jgi:heavy metal translocating P-type ATPase
MLRVNWLFLILALTGVGGGVALWSASAGEAAHLVWTAATVVAFMPLAVRVITSLLRREPGVDIIALLAMAGALLLGEALAGAVVGLMLASGQVLEGYAAARARRELTRLLERAPRVAHRWQEGTLTTTSVAEVEPGDVLLVKEADVVPVDGVVLTGPASIDVSALTGEARPVERSTGDRLDSGTVNVGAAFRMRAAARASESTYTGIVRLVEAAQQSKAPAARLADRYAAAFVPLTILIAGAAWALSGEPVRALAVLVVATPCPLLLAVPIAIVAGVSRTARRGIIVKGGGVLEALARAEFLFLDKTGTLTSGMPHLVRVATCGTWTDPAELLRLAASVDQVSSHVLAAALVRAAREQGLTLTFPTEVREAAGAGLEGTVAGHRIRVGRYDWVMQHLPSTDAATAFRHRVLRTFGSTVFVAVDQTLAGALLLEDPIRVETPRTLRALRRAGIRDITVLTGDHPVVALSVAAALGIDRVLAEQAPDEKVRAVQQARARGKGRCKAGVGRKRNRPLLAALPPPPTQSRGTTVMVGDGINDAPALAAADVGVAMGARGATASSEAADVVITTDRFDRLVEAIQIAQRCRAIARQSVLVGMGLSLVAMAVAAAGYLPPVAGAFRQEGIDLVAIASSLRALMAGRRAGEHARRRRILTPALAERLHAEHRRLGPALERLRNLADQIDTLTRVQLRKELADVHHFLTADLLEHERLDEEQIYPTIAAQLSGEDPLGPLSRTHQEIFHLARLLELLIRELPAASPEPHDLPDIRRLLYSLHAVLQLHFAQEEELYQSVSESYNTATAS